MGIESEHALQSAMIRESKSFYAQALKDNEQPKPSKLIIHSLEIGAPHLSRLILRRLPPCRTSYQ